MCLSVLYTDVCTKPTHAQRSEWGHRGSIFPFIHCTLFLPVMQKGLQPSSVINIGTCLFCICFYSGKRPSKVLVEQVSCPKLYTANTFIPKANTVFSHCYKNAT